MLLFSVLVFTAPALAQSASAQAAPSPGPAVTPVGSDGLEITNCELEYSEQGNIADKVSIEFVNHNQLPVTKIRFRIKAGLTTFPVMDMGSFKPELKIHHDLNPPAAQVAIVQGGPDGSAGELDCSVDAYTLSNGATWISPQLQSELNQR